MKPIHFFAGVALVCLVGALSIPEPHAQGHPHWANSDCAPSPRPPLAVTEEVKRRMVASQYPGHSLGEFELDHIGPLCLGGLPNNQTNFQLQFWGEAHLKDQVERGACMAVRYGRMTCEAARDMILQWNARNHRP